MSVYAMAADSVCARCGHPERGHSHPVFVKGLERTVRLCLDVRCQCLDHVRPGQRRIT